MSTTITTMKRPPRGATHGIPWPWRRGCEAKSDPQLRGLADAVVQRTGVDADDVPEVSGTPGGAVPCPPRGVLHRWRLGGAQGGEVTWELRFKVVGSLRRWLVEGGGW
eukprot:Skav209191  [mRNA]  locus=scaffold5724:43828:44151:- [translate_table: standard]